MMCACHNCGGVMFHFITTDQGDGVEHHLVCATPGCQEGADIRDVIMKNENDWEVAQ